MVIDYNNEKNVLYCIDPYWRRDKFEFPYENYKNAHADFVFTFGYFPQSVVSYSWIDIVHKVLNNMVRKEDANPFIQMRELAVDIYKANIIKGKSIYPTLLYFYAYLKRGQS